MKKCIVIMDEELFNKLGTKPLYWAELIATYEQDGSEPKENIFHIGSQSSIKVNVTKSRYPRKDAIRNKIAELVELIERKKSSDKTVLCDSFTGQESMDHAFAAYGPPQNLIAPISQNPTIGWEGPSDDLKKMFGF